VRNWEQRTSWFRRKTELQAADPSVINFAILEQLQEGHMFDREIAASQVKADRFPFPHEGDVTLAVRNKDYSLGPVMLHLVMNVGSVIWCRPQA
jgi:hypothetical protein